MTKRLALALRNAARYFDLFADPAGGDHPIDVAVSMVPEVVRLKRHLKRATARLDQELENAKRIPDTVFAKPRRIFIAQQDAELAHRTAREEIFFGVGYHLGRETRRTTGRKR
jgi:hypothetical protein